MEDRVTGLHQRGEPDPNLVATLVLHTKEMSLPCCLCPTRVAALATLDVPPSRHDFIFEADTVG